MNHYKHHEPCPKCGSKDNLAVYSDGHTYCFGCKEYTPGRTNIKEVFKPVMEYPNSNILWSYPLDIAYSLEGKVFRWLIKNNLTPAEILEYRFQYSESKKLLCWIIRNVKDEIFAWQGRSFEEEPLNKYVSHGKIHEDMCIINPKEPVLVLVEDYISAIIVGRQTASMPLFGCSISTINLLKLKEKYNKIIIWLDSDKLDEARLIKEKLNMLDIDSAIVYTEKDPKYYTNTEIRKKLNEV